jgi:glycosyltransferase involved in cell wall biosynthesis
MSARTLYICYFGIREPLVQTQVLPYLREIGKSGVAVSLLTFEPRRWTGDEIGAERKLMADTGIDWHSLNYHKRFSIAATSYDIANGIGFIIRFARAHGVNVLHARSHIPLAMAFAANKFLGLPVIFDLRGLMADEYMDSGVWKEGSLPFRVVKRLERYGLKRATWVVVLTEKMRAYLLDKKIRSAETISVIPCAVDFSRMGRGEVSKQNRFELVYAGSVTGLYMLKEMGEFFKTLHNARPDAFFRILTAGDPEFVRTIFASLSIDENDYAAARVAPENVLDIIKGAHLAISFRKPTFSQIAASPTKIPEYLACGVPVVVNDGVGDTTEIIESDKVGVVINEFSVEAYRRAIGELATMMVDQGLPARCIESAVRRFDLEKVGGERYRALYRKILQA